MLGGEIGCQEEGKDSKRRRRTGVLGGPVEGEREEGGKTTLTLPVHALQVIMQQFIAQSQPHCHHRRRNDPTTCFPSFLASLTFAFSISKNEATVFSTYSVIGVSDIFFHNLVCLRLFLVPVPARTSTHTGHVLAFVVSRFSASN